MVGFPLFSTFSGFLESLEALSSLEVLEPQWAFWKGPRFSDPDICGWKLVRDFEGTFRNNFVLEAGLARSAVYSELLLSVSLTHDESRDLFTSLFRVAFGQSHLLLTSAWKRNESENIDFGSDACLGRLAVPTPHPFQLLTVSAISQILWF